MANVNSLRRQAQKAIQQAKIEREVRIITAWGDEDLERKMQENQDHEGELLIYVMRWADKDEQCEIPTREIT